MDTAYLDSHIRMLRTALDEIENGHVADGTALLRETIDHLQALLAAEKRRPTPPAHA